MNYLYVNPNAGDGHDASYWRRVLADQGIDVGERIIDDPDAVAGLGANDRVLVAGGDGTVSLVAARCIDAGCTIAVLPSGTGNDFARGLGIPLEADAAARLAVSGTARDVDAGRIGGRYFFNVAHVGLGSEISRSVKSGDKNTWGRFSYLRKLLDSFSERRGFRARLRCGDETVRGRWLSIAIANGRSFGGGHEVVGASPFDGKIDVIAVRPRSLWQLAANWLRFRILHRQPEPQVVITLRGDSCEIARCRRQVIMADGEEAGQIPETFSVDAGVLRVVAPTTQTTAG